MTVLGQRFPLPIVPAVNPLEDSTQLDTIFFTDTDKVRFQDGKLRKIKGWQRTFSQNGQRINGAARNIFSFRDASGNPVTMVGTHRCLYAVLQNSLFYNVTPLVIATTPIPNSLSTEYNASVNVDITTTLNSDIVTLNITQYLNNNELIKISGVVSDVNGIPAANFNRTFPVTVLDTNNITINVGAPATSSGTVSVNMTWATSYIYVTMANFGMEDGDRIGILGCDSGGLGGIPASEINIEQIISNVININQFVFQTETIATSQVIDGGGTGVTIQGQIPAGNINQSVGYGYGGGLYGAGNYGAAAEFTNQSANSYPRVWSMDKWQTKPAEDAPILNYLILTPGDAAGSADGAGSNLYCWPIGNVKASILTAPTLIPNYATHGGPPAFVKWVYVSNNAICTLGGIAYPASGPAPTAGIANSFINSDSIQFTDWTPNPASIAKNYNLDQAGALISQASTRDRDLLFTEDEVYRVTFLGPPNVWDVEKLFTTDGIMGCKARAEIEDAVLWMGKGDFFVFDGTSVDILPNNTIKRYVYDNLSASQYSKCFAYANTAYNEVWFFYNTGQELEPNNYAMYNYKEKVWAIGTMSRTASEEPINVSNTPYTIQSVILFTLAPVSLSSYFYSLGTDPISTTDTTTDIVITFAYTDCFLSVGDYIQITGAVDTNGIPASEINGNKQITALIQGVSVTIQSSTAATSTGSGGGSAITIGTAVLGADMGSNRIGVNEAITLTFAPSVGGIPSSSVNVANAIVRAFVGTTIQFNNSGTNIFSTSSETITNNNSTPFEITYSSSDRLFQQEYGLNDYNPAYVYGSSIDPQAPMLAYAQTNMAQIGNGDETGVLYSVYPDTSQKGNLTLTVTGKLYAQSSLISPTLGNTNGVYTITPATTKVDLMFIARQRQYKIESFELDGNFLIGQWFEEVRPSTPR